MPIPQGFLQKGVLHVDLRASGRFGKLPWAAWETRGAVAESEGSMPRLACLVAVLALLLTACRGSGGAADADPATAVPRDALVYLEAVIRPEGHLEEDALDAAGKVLRTGDPEAKLRELLSARVAGAIAADYLEAEEEASDRSLDRSKVTERTHAGVSYQVDGEGFARAFVDDYVLFGDESELRRTIDAVTADDGGLADDDRYRDAIDGLEEERLGHFYADARRLTELVAESDPEGSQAARALIPFDRLPPVAGAFMADGSRLALDVRGELPRGSGRQLGALVGVGGTPLLEELPAYSWGAHGVPRLGETLRSALDSFGGAIGGAAMERELGVDLERDVFSWVGDAAVFVRGESVESLDGALVIGVTSPDAAEAAFGRIVGGFARGTA
jgi:hypothetical protein